MHRSAVRSRRLAWILSALLALTLTVPAGAAAARHARRFPVPTCRWAPTALIDKTLGIQVRALKPSWRTQIAPVLGCAYVERQPNLQFGNVPIVRIEFRELQRFRVPAGWTEVKGLGRCVVRSSCPRGGGSAYEQIIQSWSPTASGSGTTSGSGTGSGTGSTGGTTSGSGGSSGTDPGTGSTSGSGSSSTSSGSTSTGSDGSTNSPTAFVSSVTLSVEDGLNMVAIQVETPNGPLPVASTQAAVRKLARALLPHFYWR